MPTCSSFEVYSTEYFDLGATSLPAFISKYSSVVIGTTFVLFPANLNISSANYAKETITIPPQPCPSSYYQTFSNIF